MLCKIMLVFWYSLLAFISSKHGVTGIVLFLLSLYNQVSRTEQHIAYELLEQCCRLDLDRRASRALVVLDPLKVTLQNWPGTDLHAIL